MTEVLNMTFSPSQESHSSANGSVYPILSQPASRFNEVPEMAQEELEREKREDCCCAKFFLCRCLSWWCEMFRECAASWFDGFTDCVNSCCDSNKNQNGQDCCFGCECDDCEGGDVASNGSFGSDRYGDDGYVASSDMYNDDNGYDGGAGDDGGCDGGTSDYGGTCDDGGGGYDGGTCDD